MLLYLMWMSINGALSNVDVHYGALPIVGVHLWCST
jgi:hypothetical protein